MDRISREVIEELFQNTHDLVREGRATFRIDEPCRWSYFFVDSDPALLEEVASEFPALGYEVAGILEPADETEEDPVYFLRVDRIETHDVDSLLARNDELYALAERLGVDGYDGMDVGAIDGP